MLCLVKFGYDILQKTKELEVKEFIKKPFDVENLLDKIKLIKEELDFQEPKPNLELINISDKKENIFYKLLKKLLRKCK